MRRPGIFRVFPGWRAERPGVTWTREAEECQRTDREG
jgi:hypothetical protein